MKFYAYIFGYTIVNCQPKMNRVEAGNFGQVRVIPDKRFFVLYNFLLLTMVAVYHYQLFYEFPTSKLRS